MKVEPKPPRPTNYRTNAGQLRGMKEASKERGFQQRVNQELSRGNQRGGRRGEGWRSAGVEGRDWRNQHAQHPQGQHQQTHQGQQYQHQVMTNPPPPLGLNYPNGINPMMPMGPPSPVPYMNFYGAQGNNFVPNNYQGNQQRGQQQWDQRRGTRGNRGSRGRRGRY